MYKTTWPQTLDILILILFILPFSVKAAMEPAPTCPTECRCTFTTRSINESPFTKFIPTIQSIDCSTRFDLTSLIPSIPTSLETLSLSNGKFRDSLPRLGSLPNLKKLSLNHCSIDSNQLKSLPFSSLSQLQELSLANNDIERLPPGLLENQTHLLHLDLSSNRLTIIPDSTLSRLHALQSIDLSGNSFYGQVLLGPGWSNLKQLQSIDFSLNQAIDSLGPLSIEIMLSWSRETGKKLNFSNCDIREIKPRTFGKAYHLQILDLSHNKNIPAPQLSRALDDLESSYLLEKLFLKDINLKTTLLFKSTNLIYLRHLDISYNLIETLSDDVFYKWKAIETLDMSHNRISTLGPAFGATLGPKSLDLSFNHLTSLNQIPTLGNLHRLTTMDLSQNELTGTYTDVHFPISQSLETLNLKRNQLAGVKLLATRPRLKVLNLAENQIKEATLLRLGPLVNLEQLLLQSNKLTQIDRLVLPASSRLQTLNLSRNNLESLDASSVEGLKCKTIDLSHNLLTALPSKPPTNSDRYNPLELDYLQSRWTWYGVETLDLSNNRIYTLAPQILQPLSSTLTTLKITHNRLPFLDPEIFKTLPHISHLFLGHNQLGSYLSGPDTIFLLQPISNTLRYLDLSTNFIENIQNDFLKPLHSLETLDLSGNLLRNISNDSFQTLISLKNVNLSFCRFGDLKPGTLRPLLGNTFDQISLNLNGNPWQCSCNLLNLQSWLRNEKTSRRLRLHGLPYTCIEERYGIPKIWLAFSRDYETDLTRFCGETPAQAAMDIDLGTTRLLTAVGGAFLFLTIVLVLCIVWIKIAIPRRRRKRINRRNAIGRHLANHQTPNASQAGTLKNSDAEDHVILTETNVDATLPRTPIPPPKHTQVNGIHPQTRPNGHLSPQPDYYRADFYSAGTTSNTDYHEVMLHQTDRENTLNQIQANHLAENHRPDVISDCINEAGVKVPDQEMSDGSGSQRCKYCRSSDESEAASPAFSSGQSQTRSQRQQKQHAYIYSNPNASTLSPPQGSSMCLNCNKRLPPYKIKHYIPPYAIFSDPNPPSNPEPPIPTPLNISQSRFETQHRILHDDWSEISTSDQSKKSSETLSLPTDSEAMLLPKPSTGDSTLTNDCGTFSPSSLLSKTGKKHQKRVKFDFSPPVVNDYSPDDGSQDDSEIMLT